MQPKPTVQRPDSGAGYVPYFYQIGLHYLYLTPSQMRTRQTPESDADLDRFASDSRSKRFLDHPQTVEQIVSRGYFAVSAGDPAMAIIDDKAATSWLGLDDVITQVRRRYEIHNRVLDQIDAGICASINAIYQHEAYVGPGSATSKQHYAKHKAIQELYAEKRLEQVSLWKDVSRLKTLLPENAQMYLAAHRKRSILQAPDSADDVDPGDAV